MKYVLSLVLVTSAALAAARVTPRDPGIRQVATPDAVVREADPPWVTGAWQAAVLEGRVDGDSAGPGDDPHAGLLAVSGQCSRDQGHPRLAAVTRSSAENGLSVAEVFARRQSLGDRRVRVRGTIVKLTEGILGKTYLHLEDGSGSPEAGDFDLTVASEDAFELGETVEVEGHVLVDHDLGIGYRYAALLDDARRIAPN